MARPLSPLEETIGGEIYNILLEFVDHARAIPNPHAFWKKVLIEQKGYIISRSAFDYWWMRLQLAGLIQIEPLTRAVKVRDVRMEIDNPL